MKERLIELLEKASAEAGKHFRETTKKVLAEKGRFNSAEDIDRRNIYEVEADYLIENGVIVPPCKVGQTVYRVVTMGTGVTFKKVGFNTYREKKQTIKHFIRCVTVTKNNFFDVCENWGISVFATKEEAEQKLKVVEGK